MFFSGFPRMVGLPFFPRLCQLTIVSQAIEHIEALESCPLLQELWVVECLLTGISGLQNCLQLQKLYLYDNQICEINNLELQVNLEVLWLNNNHISQIQGLNTLTNLKELNLSDNSIEFIGHSLDSNASLQNLNISGNKISSFKELTTLAHLPHLTDLALNDPMSTPNPVCLLCNYATHVLYHMPGLRRLDIYDVSSRQNKELAESTVMKKMMYYNMRVRTAQRDLERRQLNLVERKKSLSRSPEECVRRISHALKSLEGDLSKGPGVCKKSASNPDDGSFQLVDGLDPTSASHDAAMERKIHSKIEALKRSLVVWTGRLSEIEAGHEQDLILARNTMDYTVQFLQMELESVGNIRLKEGCSTDPWFESCCHLLLSRFRHSDFKSHNVSGVTVRRIFHIQNRAIRLRFDDKLRSVLVREDGANTSQDYKRHLEYLFHIPEPEKGHQKEELLCILEDGFKSAAQWKTLDRGGAVPLTNSLSAADIPRIEHEVRRASKEDSEPAVSFSNSQVVVSKVFVGHSVPVSAGEPLHGSSYPAADSVYCDLDTKERTALGEEGSDGLGKQTGVPPRRRWFVFDHELVLPEYIIFFEYITGSREQPLLQNGLSKSDDSPSDAIDREMEVLNMEPVVKPQPKSFSFDDKIGLHAAQANVLSQISVLNLHGNSLSTMKAISHLTALRHLTISFNKFTCLDDISHMPNLEFLDASFNQLTTLEGLRALGQLKQLDVCWNQLTNARDESLVLRKHTPALLKLNARYNPWKRPKAVRATVLGHLVTLTHLDDVMVTKEESSIAVQMVARSEINQACLLAHSRTDSDRPRGLSLLSVGRPLCHLSPAPWGPNQELEFDWAEKITSLNLDNQRISKLINLEKLVNLRWASFNDNDISTVEGLDSCVKLEELSLNNNSISTLSLPKLHRLTKLSVDGNQLSSLDVSVLDQLPNLSFLSVEKNYISCLCGTKRASALLELYVGDNNISLSQDVRILKGLTNLIILDLYGNPLLEKIKNYRLYVIFQLPFLKILDGIAVDATESDDAKLKFEGMLTPDVLEELGHSNFTGLVNLILHSCSFKTVDLCPADLFSSLRAVDLDNNNLTSFCSLIYLPNIKELSLNYNHIESILPSQKTHQTKKQLLHSNVPSSGYGQQSSAKGKWETWPNCRLEPLMSSLEVLHLRHNGISNMANLQLSRLTNLKALFLQGNEISHVEGLEGLCHLRKLMLDKNRIKALDYNSFISQNALVALHLTENRIRDLSHLDPLTELRKLFLGMNRLQSIAELDKLDVLPSLTVLSVVGNPVAKNSFYRPEVVLQLSTLQVLDGVTITLEERTSAELLLTDPSDLTGQCPQCAAASLLPTEINLPGFLPLLPRYTPLRGISVAGGLQGNTDEAQSHHKDKHSNTAQDGQTDVAFRHTGRLGSNPTTTGVSHDGTSHRHVSQPGKK
ncbi:leucine-rich repeat-containing protein 9-like [Brachionichthys hirsutus]|uniref:leucine-rich repeat-containing protein 9-like n=1 Tax=Brachionichthys hirsutus TaxID=412623 RepID=UPI003604AF6D